MRKTSIGDYRIFAFTLVLLFVSSAVFGALPRAHHIYISGSTAGTTFETKIVKNFTGMRVGQTLRVWYTYADADGVAGAQAESGTTFQWYTYDDNLGTNKQAIAGATAVTFAITAAQVGKHISVEVRPRNTADGFGAIYEFRPWDASNPNPVYTTNGNCGKPNGIGVPVPGNQILSPSGLCSPRSLTWQVQYTGINWQTTGGLVPKIVINWGDGVVETLDPRLFNTTTLTYDVGLYNPMATRADTLNLTNILNQNWRVEQPHIYDYTIGGRTPSATPNERCTYTMTTSWGVGGSSCIGIGNQTQKFAVWDNEANTNLGTLDMNHQTGTGGFETGEITDICPFDRTAIRLVDASDFNCTPGGIVENPNPNDQARWVQFVYGTTNTMTTGAAAGQQFTINGTNYTAAQLPVYGPVLYLPATVTTPSAITLNMQMPTTATAGQQMVVTMRTWNTCAAFDRLLFDANGLNPPQAIATFDIYSPAGSVISPLGAAPFYANGIPATRTYTIRIATAPPPPTVTYTANHCDTDADNTFTFTTSHTQVNSTLRWYSDAALTNLQKSSTSSNTFNPITEGTPAMVKATTATTKVVTYYVTEQWPGANGCTSQPQTMTFNITDTNSGGAIDHPNEIGTTSVVAICSGADPPAFTNATSASGGTGGFTYQWESSTTGPASGFSNIASATAATYDPPVTNVTTWFRRRAISGFCPDAYSNVFQIRADVAVTPGSINGAQTVCETSDPTILGSVTAGGAGDGTTYTYQWESSTVGVAGPFNTIVGATSTTYDPPVLPQTTFFRRRVVSGVCVGTNTAYSNVITITVHDINDPGVIGNPQTICSGQDPTALTNVTAASGGDGTNYVYQWQQATALGGPYTDIVGATATTYDPGVLTATTFYRRRVRSPGPVATTCPETFSNVITITVNPLPAGNVSGGGSICSGNPAPDIVFTFTAGTGPWNLVYSISGTNQPIVNNVTSPYTITSPAAGTYRIVSLTDANGCSVTAPSANLTFTAPASVVVGGFPPAFDTAPSLAATSVCSAGAATTDPSLSFSLDGFSTGAGTYVLTYTVDGGSSLTKNFTVNVANGDVSAPLTFSEAAFNNTTPSPHTLRIVSILSPTGCQTVFNTNLSFTVNPLPVGVNKTVTAVCAPATLNIDPFATSVAVGVGGNGVNSTYTWTAAYPPAITGGAASGSGNITGTLANVSGTVQTAVFTVTPTSVVGSCLGSTFTISVPVNPQPVLVAGQTKTICSGASVAYHIQLNPLDLPANTVFNWPDPDGAGPATAGTNVALGAAATLHINDVLTNVTGAPITVNYVVTPTAPAAGCAGAAQTIAITVNPAPVLVNPQSKTICSGSAVAYHIQLTPTDLPANTVFNWPDPDGAGPATAGTNVALGTAATIHINDVLTNTTGSATTVNYVVTPSAGGCAGTARTIPITVNPAPVITAAQTKTICSGEAVNYRVLLTPNNLPAGTTFTWTAPTMSAGGAQGSGGTNVPASNALHLTDVLVNTGSSPITATYAITPTAAGCVGATQNVVITINPLPVANPIVGQGTVCAGTNIILYQVTPNAGSTYTWTIDPLFQVFGGGGTSDFFVLLRFPTVGTGNIRVVETNTFPGKNCSGAANVFPITVAPAPSALTIDGADPVCKGQTGVVYEVPVALFNPASTYTWTASGANIVSATSGVGLRQITVDFGLLASASITVSETSSSGCAGTPVTKNISVSDRPTMTSATATSVCSGSAPSLNFTANLPSTFSWQVITVSGSISGTAVGNTGTGNINQVLTNTSGFSGTVTYRVTPIGTAAPLCAGPTQDVVVTVNPEPVLSLTNKTLCSDQPAQYEIKLTPLNLPAGTTFTWAAPTMSSGGPQGTSGTSIPMGAAGTIHINDTFVNTGTTAITATYVIQATSGLGCNSNQPAASRLVVFTINPKPVGGTDNSPVICSKASPNYSLANNIATLGNNLVAGTTFSWIAASNGNVTGESFGSAQTTATITDVLRNQTNSDQIVVYTVTPTSSNGCAGSPFTVRVTVHPEPKGFNDTPAAICSNNAVGYSLTANVANTGAGANGLTAGTTYDWSGSTNVNVSGTSTTTQTGSTITDVLRNFTTVDQTVVYTVTPKSSNGCVGDPFTVTVTVKPEPVGVNSTVTVCSDVALGVTLTTNPASVAAANYTIAVNPNGLIQSAGTPSAGASKAANEIADDVWTNTTAAAVNVVYTITPVSAANCPGSPFTITVTVNPEPIGVAQTPTRCSDELVNVTLGVTGASVPAATYTIAVNSNGLTFSGTTASAGSAKLANELADDRWTNPGLVPVNVIYTVTPVSAAGCSGNSFTVTVSVLPEPVGANSTLTLCSDDLVNVNLTTSASAIAATTYNIATNANGLTQSAGTVSAGTAKLANELADDRWTNIGLNPVDVVYTVTPVSAAGCAGDPFTVTVTVRPEPSAPNSTVTRCSDELVNTTIATNVSSVAAASFNIAVNANGLTFSGTTASGGNGKLSNELVDDKWTNTGLNPVNVVYTITPVSPLGCLGDPFTITVTVRPEPVGNNSSATVCSDHVLGISLTTNVTSVAAANYTIAVNPNGLIQSAGTASSGVNKAANELADDVWRNTGLTPVNVIYTITPFSAAGCAGDPFTITLTVNPEPVGTSSATTVCGNSSVNVNLTTNVASVAAASFDIAINANGLTLASGTPSAGTGKAATEIADDVWANTGLGPVNVVYTITPVSAAGCDGDPFTVTVTVNPQPVGSPMTATRCSDASVSLTLSTSAASVAASSYNIATNAGGLTQVSGTVSAGTGKAANEISDDVWNNTGLNPVNVVYTINPVSAAGCIGDPFTVTVTINPEPVGSNSSATRCSDQVLGINLSTSGLSVAAATYNIAVNANGLTQSAGTASSGVGKLLNEIADDVWRNTGLAPVNVVYTVTPVSAAGCDGNPFTVTVTINPEPVGANSTVSKCSDEVLGINLTTSATAVAAANYTIAVNANGLTQVAGTNSAGAGKAATEISDDVWRNTTSAPVDVIYTVTPFAATGCTGDPFTVTVTINPEPIGVAQNITRCSDETLSINLGVTGASVAASTYNISVVSNGLTFSGTTASAGTGKLATELADDKWTNTGLLPVNVVYTVNAVSAAGCVGDPFTVTVSVNPEPVGANSTATRCSDDLVGVNLTTSASSVAAATFNITTNNNGLTQSAGTASAGTGKASNELADDRWTNTGLNPVDVIYTIVPVSAAGCAGDPFTVTITVRPEPVGANSTAVRCSDELLNLTLSTSFASVAAASYNIAINPNGLTFSGATASGGAAKLANELMDDKWTNNGLNPVDVVYTVTPVSAQGCLGDPFTVTVTIRPEPVGVTATTTVCSDVVVGGSITTTATSVGASVFTIAVNPNGLIQSAGTNSAGSNKLANEIANDAWRNTGLNPVDVIYTITPFSAAGCAGDDFTITVTVNPEPVGSNSTTTICANAAVSVNLTTNPASVAAASYTIAVNSNGLTLVGGTASAGSGKAANELADDRWSNTGLGPVNVIYTVTPVSAAGCFGDPFTVTVTVNPEPVGTPVTTTRCSDDAVAVPLTTSATAVSASSFNITTNSNGLTQVGGSVSAGTGKAANELVDDVWRNTGLLPVDVVYTIVPVSASGCSGAPFLVTVTINPKPVGSSSTLTKCSDEVLGVSLTTSVTSVAAANYNITVAAAGGLTLSAGTASAGNGKAATELADDVWRNTGLSPANVVYTIVPVSAAGCLGDAFTVTATIRPEPVGTNSTLTRCSDVAVGSNITTSGASVAATSFDIAVNANGLTQSAGTASAGLAKLATEIADDVWTNTGLNPVDVVYTITPYSAAGCAGDPFTITVTVNPEPVGAASTITQCSDVDLNITLTTSVTSVSAATYVISIVSNGLTYSGPTPSAGSGKLASEIADDRWTNTGLVPVDVVYTITPVSASGCSGDPFDVTVTINPEPVGSNGTATRCSDDLVNFTLSTSAAAVSAATYNISVNANGLTFSGTTPSGGNGKAANELVDDAWTNVGLIPVNVIYTVTPVSADGCEGNPFTVNVTVRPEPVGFDSNVVVCSDEQTSFTLSTNGSSVAATTYNITVNANGLTQSAGSNSQGSGKVASELFTDAWRNTTNAPVDVIYTVIPVSAGPAFCQGDSFIVTVTVNPEPVGVPTTATKCSDEVLGIAIATTGGSAPAATFNITVNAGGLTQSGGTPSAGTGKLANEIADDQWNNVTNAPVVVVYTIVPITAAPESCQGDSFQIAVTINPEPVGQNVNISDCSTTLNYNIQTANIDALGNGLASVFTYVVTSSDEIAVPTPPALDRIVASNSPITDSFTNLSGAAVDVTYTITPFNAASPSCGGTPFTYTVRISPKPVGVSNTKAAVCSDVAYSFDPQNDLSPSVASTFTWTVVYDAGLSVRVAKSPKTGTLAETLTNTTAAVLNAVYTVIPTAAGSSCVGDPFTVTVPILPEPVVASNLDLTQCSDVAYGQPLNTNGVSVAATTYDITAVIEPGLTGVASTGTGLLATALNGDVFNNVTSAQLRVTYTVIPRAANSCYGDAKDVIFKVNPEPVLAPQAIPDICSNNIDNPSTTGIVLGTNGSSITASSYTLTTIQYKLVSAGAFGAALPAGVTTGANATAPSTSNFNIVKNDKFTNIASEGVMVKYTLTASSPQSCVGNPVDYIITVNPQPTLDPSLSPTPVCSDLPSSVTLGVDPGPPASVAAASYIIRSINFTGLTPGPTNTGTGTGKAANAIFNDSYTNVTANPIQATYSIAPVSGVGCVGLNKDVALTINPSPNLDVLPAVTCNDGTSGIVFATTFPSDPNGVPAANYDVLSILADAGLTPNGGNVAAQNGVAAAFVQNDRFHNTTLTTKKVRYSVRPVSAANCKGPAKTVELTVEPIIEIVPNPAAASICGDGLVNTNIQLTSGSVPSAGGITFSYSATASSALVSGFGPIVSNLTNPSTIGDLPVNNSNVVQTITYTVTPSAAGAKNGAGCVGTPVPIVVTVEPKPKLTIPSTKTICENDAVNIVLTSPTVPSTGAASVSVDMIAAPTGNVTGFVTPATFANGATLGDILVNNDPTNSSVEYKFTPKFGTCVGSQVSTIVTVSPRPVITPIANFDICSGEIFNPVPITVDTDPSSTFIQWTVAADPDISGESGGAGNSFSQVLFNNSANPKTLTYTLTARNIGNVPACNGSPVQLLVGVYPVPKMVGLPPSVNVCNNATNTVNLNSSATGTTYNWIVDNNGNPDLPVIANGGGSSSIVQTYVNNGTSLGSYQYQVTPTVIIPSNSKNCVGNPGIMVVNVAPPIVGQLYSSDGDATAFICKGSKDFVFFDFGGLPLFEYTYSDGVAPPKTVSGKGPIDIVTVQPTTTTTYTLLSVKDGFGCVQNVAGQSVTVNVGFTDASFSINGPAIACSPFQVKFQHNEVAGVNYTWKWFDGGADSTYLAASNVNGQLIPHTFKNPAPRGTVTYKVFLEAFLDDNYPGACRTTTNKSVQVYPTVAPAVFPDKTEICSDETITFVNSSQGVTQQNWFYRVQGSTTPLDPRTTASVTYKIPNTTSSNPIVYEVVYQSTNGNCPAADVVTPITVYRGIDAHFSHTSPTVFVGGHSFMTLTNDSQPVDGTDFRYEWDFGANATPLNAVAVGPTFNLDYSTPGPKELVVRATNIVAEAAGLSCFDEYRETITITVPPLIADFTAIPLAACFPTDITVTENKATGDKFSWRVIDAAGTAAQSNAVLPVFKIPAPGKYTVELVTSNSFTGDQKTATKDVIIYDLPMASFDVRPGVVYVPDTELSTFNFSDGANAYVWDFGDGTTADTKEPKHTYKVEGVYDVMLIAQNDHGNGVVCADTLTRKVTAKQGGVTRVPNAFTPDPSGPSAGGAPNSNTFNDVFLPQVKGAEEFNMQVFDRWGNLVFESNNANVGWDGYDRHGRLMPAGVYVYKLTLRLSDGQRTTQIGDITMIR